MVKGKSKNGKISVRIHGQTNVILADLACLTLGVIEEVAKSEGMTIEEAIDLHIVSLRSITKIRRESNK